MAIERVHNLFNKSEVCRTSHYSIIGEKDDRMIIRIGYCFFFV